ncbi:sorting nexin-5-like [Anneissia japonica]|uniref:sorting nexin-5-like n=1 Tax=Anneissia japonica TaxID=1529436 RepID=UPI0014257A65|nr:sorting nexin-5-like [Anneissia japonica]
MSDSEERTERQEDISEVNGDEEEVQSKPFQPWYSVQIKNASKNGDIVMFDVTTTKLEQCKEEVEVERQYEDFEWLEHCLSIQQDVKGVIFPPLPDRPIVSAAEAEARSKKQLGTQSKNMKGDEFHKDCRKLEKYLQAVVKHEAFGKNEALMHFLTKKEPPVRAKLKKGILSNLSRAVDGVRKGGHKDVDETFQKERELANDMLKITKESSVTFDVMVNNTCRISAAYNHLSTALCLGMSAEDNGASAVINKLQAEFAKSIDHYAHGVDVFSTNDDNTLGFTLEYYSRYWDSTKEMLFRRTCALVQYENCSKTLEKAKPQKKAMAEAAKDDAEKELNSISEVAKKEIAKFHHQRTLDFQKSLILYAEAKVKAARDVYALLAKDLSTIKQMDVDFD